MRSIAEDDGPGLSFDKLIRHEMISLMHEKHCHVREGVR